jgi:hypothetical protein
MSTERTARPEGVGTLVPTKLEFDKVFSAAIAIACSLILKGILLYAGIPPQGSLSRHSFPNASNGGSAFIPAKLNTDWLDWLTDFADVGNESESNRQKNLILKGILLYAGIPPQGSLSRHSFPKVSLNVEFASFDLCNNRILLLRLLLDNQLQYHLV